MTALRIIGDIHGAREIYLGFLEGAGATIQVGDLDNTYDWMPAEGIDVGRHRFFTGNHDNMDLAPQSPYNLGDFGVHAVPGFGEVFFVRGGFSVDWKTRRSLPTRIGETFLAQNYWPEREELSRTQLEEAMALYREVKPSFVLSHECPLSVVQYVTNPRLVEVLGYSEPVIKTRTNQALEAMLAINAPRTWCFGHYHCQKSFEQSGTRFHCIDRLEAMDFEA